MLDLIMDVELPDDLLGTQLSRKLNDEDVSLEDRFKTAELVFLSSTIGILNKEELVFKWLAGLMKRMDVVAADQSLSLLEKCLTNERMLEFRGEIKPSVCEELFSALNLVVEWGTYELLEKTRRCIALILSLNYFQVWFARAPKDILLLAKNYFSSQKNDNTYQEDCNALKMLLNVHKQCILKKEFRHEFVKVFVPALLRYSAKPKNFDDDGVGFETLIASCFDQITFYEPKLLLIFIRRTNETKTLEDEDNELLVDALKNFLKDKNVYAVGLIFRSLLLLTINKAEEELVLELFSGLCKLMGINVHRMFSVNVSPIPKWSARSSFHTISRMVELLTKKNVSYNIELEGVSLQKWLTTLIISLVNINTGSLTPELLILVDTVYTFNPLTIEPSLKSLAYIFIQKKFAALLPSYIQLMSSFFSGCKITQRLTKLFPKLLTQVFDLLTFSCDDELTLESILPTEIFNRFCQVVKALSNSQALETFKILTYHLETSFVNKFQAGQIDIETVVASEITSSFLQAFLDSTVLTDQSVPDIFQNKFQLMLQDLSELLERWAKALIDYDHNDRINLSFFKLCIAFARMRYYIQFYITQDVRGVVLSDLVPTNLHYILPFITPDDWERIAQKIDNHTDCHARNGFFKLLIQKITCIRGVEEGRNVPSVKVAQYLLEHADREWLWLNMKNFSALLEPLEMMRFMSDMTDFHGDDQSKWSHVITDMFTENRSLNISLAFSIFNKMSSFYPANKGGFISQKVLRLLDPSKLIELELSLTLTDHAEEAPEIQASILAMNNVIETFILEPAANTNISPHKSFFPLVDALPLQYLSPLTNAACTLALLGLLHDIPRNEENDKFIFKMLSKLINKAKDDASFTGVDPGIMYMFLGQRGKGYPLLKDILLRVCRNAFMKRKTAKKLMKRVSQPTEDTLWLSVLVIRAIIQCKNKTVFSSGNQTQADDDNKALKKLSKKDCIKKLTEIVLPLMLEARPCVENLNEFSIILNHVITTRDPSAESIISKVPGYIEVAISHYDSSSQFFYVLLSNRASLREVLSSDFVEKLWKCPFENDEDIESIFIKRIALFSTADEFARILDNLKAETELNLLNFANEPSGSNILKCFSAWKFLLAEQISTEKARLRLHSFTSLSDALLKSIAMWHPNSHSKAIKCIFETFTTFVHNVSLELTPAMIDLIFEALANVPLPKDKHYDLLQNFDSAVDCLYSLYLFRNTLIVDRVAVLLQLYRHFLNTLAVSVSLVHDNFPVVYKYTMAASKLEKFSRTIAKRKKNFTRISSYVVADVIAVFEKHVLDPTFKSHYTNIFYSFMSLCDVHGINYLKISLPAHHQVLFRVMLEEYNAHHRFTGRI